MEVDLEFYHFVLCMAHFGLGWFSSIACKRGKEHGRLFDREFEDRKMQIDKEYDRTTKMLKTAKQKEEG